MSDFQPTGDAELDRAIEALMIACWGIVIVGTVAFFALVRYAWGLLG